MDDGQGKTTAYSENCLNPNQARQHADWSQLVEASEGKT